MSLGSVAYFTSDCPSLCPSSVTATTQRQMSSPLESALNKTCMLKKQTQSMTKVINDKDKNQYIQSHIVTKAFINGAQTVGWYLSDLSLVTDSLAMICVHKCLVTSFQQEALYPTPVFNSYQWPSPVCCMPPADILHASSMYETQQTQGPYKYTNLSYVLRSGTHW